MRLLGVRLAAYRAPRLISGANCVIGGVVARQAIPADDSFVTTYVRVCVLETASAFAGRHPSVSPDILNNDWQLWGGSLDGRSLTGPG